MSASSRRRQTADNASTPQRKPFGGYSEDTRKRAGDNGGYSRFARSASFDLWPWRSSSDGETSWLFLCPCGEAVPESVALRWPT
jgi:hypothetical protein